MAVKLCGATNYKRSNDTDGWFATKSIEHDEELASLFEPILTSCIQQYDKAHAPIGITAPNKQSPLLMISDIVVIGTKQKLTPTVIDLCEIQDAPLADSKAVKYSGPNLIQVKSPKHTPSTAAVQIEAIDEILKAEQICKLKDDQQSQF